MPIIERGDAVVREQWDGDTRIYRRWQDGQLVEERPFTEAENAAADRQLTDAAREVNRRALVDRVRTALATDQAYLDKVQAGTATNADHIGQVPALTRQTMAIIRLLAGSDLLDQT